MKTWEQMSPLEQSSAIWWDLYKDVHGRRPRGIDTRSWDLDEFTRQIDGLQEALERQMADERQEQAKSVARFENRIREFILGGAGDRETALVWIAREIGAGHDMEYMEFRFNLPYGYLRTVA